MPMRSSLPLRNLPVPPRTVIRQRVKAGLKPAVAQGVKLGRPKVDGATEHKVRKQLAKGVGILKVAKWLGLGTGTVQRISKERVMSPRRNDEWSPAHQVLFVTARLTPR